MNNSTSQNAKKVDSKNMCTPQKRHRQRSFDQDKIDQGTIVSEEFLAMTKEIKKKNRNKNKCKMVNLIPEIQLAKKTCPVKTMARKQPNFFISFSRNYPVYYLKTKIVMDF